ncbi:hypothetical protein ES703_99444 [subsurface metagenome]
MTLKRLVIAWLILNVLDIILTFIGLSMGGTELNPLLAGLSSLQFVGFKIALTSLIGLWWLIKEEQRMAIIGCIMVTAVVIWNMGMIVWNL